MGQDSEKYKSWRGDYKATYCTNYSVSSDSMETQDVIETFLRYIDKNS